jgi:acetyl-CoA C-acetyltransferase
MSGVSIGEVGHFDLYSCFSSAVQIGRDMLGIAPDDPRLLTVTGGLPYFGGPGNNYVTHSVAAMVGRLRGDRGAIGLVTANGWYVTKHAVGVYSTDPPRRPWERTDPAVDQSAVDAGPHPSFTEEPSGDATVETYTVVFGREGAPELGIVIGQTDDGTRFIANTPSDRALLESMTSTEMVGARGTVTSGDTNIFTPA